MKLPWLEHGEHGVASIISSGKQRDMAKTTVASDQSSGRARTEEAQGKWHHSWQMEKHAIIVLENEFKCLDLTDEKGDKMGSLLLPSCEHLYRCGQPTICRLLP